MLLNDWVWKPLLPIFSFYSFFLRPCFPVCFPIGAYSFPILSALPVTQPLSSSLLSALSVTQVWRDFWSDKFWAAPGKLAGCHAAAACFQQLLFPRHTLHLQLHFPPLVFILSTPKGTGNGAMQKQQLYHWTISDSCSLRNYRHVVVYHLVIFNCAFTAQALYPYDF